MKAVTRNIVFSYCAYQLYHNDIHNEGIYSGNNIDFITQGFAICK
jgi:hypothetical protein